MNDVHGKNHPEAVCIHFVSLDVPIKNVAAAVEPLNMVRQRQTRTIPEIRRFLHIAINIAMNLHVG